jgi:endonuclease/exonuclease/phosphatase family metal-dependent hydrolase
MQFRVVTLNLEQDHKRWSDRHPLISAEIAGLRPDVIALNEVCVPLQTARLLRDAAIAATGIPYKLVQQTRVNGLSKVEGEALLTRFEVVETGNLDYQTRDIVALVARVVIGERPVDFAHGLHPARRSEGRGLASLLAADGPLHRLHLDFRRHRDPRQRGLLQSPEPRRSVAVVVRPRRCLGRPADIRKCVSRISPGVME